MNKKRGLGVAVAAVLLLGACGDDDDDNASGDADADYAAFCQAELEQAVSEGDPAAIDTAFANLIEATPDDDKATAERTVTEAKVFLESDEAPTPEFEEAYGDLIDIVKDNCGFAELDVTAKDYEFEGIGDTVDAGPNVITLENEGQEIHEIQFLRLNDGVELSVEELLELPEEEALQKVTPAGGGFAMPGATGHSVADLAPGKYLALCFIPVGTTPDAVESGDDLDGEPHALHGMVAEFEVS